MKGDGDGLGDGRHPDDDLVVMAARDSFSSDQSSFLCRFLVWSTFNYYFRVIGIIK